MSEENILFQPIKKYCRRNVATCSPDDSVLNVAGMMRKLQISSVIVCQGSRPEGILTDRDLRNKVVALGLDPASLTARDIMNAPLIPVGEDDFIFTGFQKTASTESVSSIRKTACPGSLPSQISCACKPTLPRNWSGISTRLQASKS